MCAILSTVSRKLLRLLLPAVKAVECEARHFLTVMKRLREKKKGFLLFAKTMMEKEYGRRTRPLVSLPWRWIFPKKVFGLHTNFSNVFHRKTKKLLLAFTVVAYYGFSQRKNKAVDGTRVSPRAPHARRLTVNSKKPQKPRKQKAHSTSVPHPDIVCNIRCCKLKLLLT